MTSFIRTQIYLYFFSAKSSRSAPLNQRNLGQRKSKTNSFPQSNLRLIVIKFYIIYVKMERQWRFWLHKLWKDWGFLFNGFGWRFAPQKIKVYVFLEYVRLRREILKQQTTTVFNFWTAYGVLKDQKHLRWSFQINNTNHF